jgi:hypothetical protein
LHRRRRVLCRWRNGILLGWRSARLGGRGEDEAIADQSKAQLWELGLEELIFRAGEEIGFSAGDGGEQVVDDDRFAVERALLVGVGSQQDGNDGAFLFGNDGP